MPPKQGVRRSQRQTRVSGRRDARLASRSLPEIVVPPRCREGSVTRSLGNAQRNFRNLRLRSRDVDRRPLEANEHDCRIAPRRDLWPALSEQEETETAAAAPSWSQDPAPPLNGEHHHLAPEVPPVSDYRTISPELSAMRNNHDLSAILNGSADPACCPTCGQRQFSTRTGPPTAEASVSPTAPPRSPPPASPTPPSPSTSRKHQAQVACGSEAASQTLTAAQAQKRPRKPDEGPAPERKRARKVRDRRDAELSNETFLLALRQATIVVRASDIERESLSEATLQHVSQRIIVWLDKPTTNVPAALRTIKIDKPGLKIQFQQERYPKKLFANSRSVGSRTPLILNFNTSQASEFAFLPGVQAWVGNCPELSIGEIVEFLGSEAQIPLVDEQGPNGFKSAGRTELLTFITEKSKQYQLRIGLHISVLHWAKRPSREALVRDVSRLDGVSVLCDAGTFKKYKTELKRHNIKYIEPKEPEVRQIGDFQVNDHALSSFECSPEPSAYRIVFISSGAGCEDGMSKLREEGEKSSVVIAPRNAIAYLLRRLGKDRNGTSPDGAENISDASDQDPAVTSGQLRGDETQTDGVRSTEHEDRLLSELAE